MNASVVRLALSLLVPLLISACGHTPINQPSASGALCSGGTLLVCPIDRPTISDPRAVRASGACRCLPTL